MNVEWRYIQEFPGYQVSNTGLVKSVGRVIAMKNGVNKTIKEKCVSQFYCGHGYRAVHLSPRNQTRYVHRLVAEAFIPRADKTLEVNHIDENKENNCVWNLEWVTRRQNIDYGTRNSRCAEYGLKSAKRVVAYRNGVLIKRYRSVREVGRDGYSRQSVNLCCEGKRGEIRGVTFRYEVEAKE